MNKCLCGHRNLVKGHDIEAIVYTMGGAADTVVKTMRCTSYGCRKTYGPNFVTDAGFKINTALPEDVDEVLSVSVKRGFTVDYLKHHVQLEFRAFVSAGLFRTFLRMSSMWRTLTSSAVSGRAMRTRSCVG